MKRSYPISLFLLGILGNGIRYFFIGVIGLIFCIIGSRVPACKTIGTIVLAGYALLCVIEQFVIRHVCLKQSDDPEINALFDAAFGASGNGENSLSDDKITKEAREAKPQDADLPR